MKKRKRAEEGRCNIQMGLQFKLREVRVDLMERDLSEGGEGVSHLDIWRRMVQTEGMAGAETPE